MIKVTDRFLAPSRGTIDDVLAFFKTNPPARPRESELIVRRIYALCAASGMDFALAMARIADETGALNGPSFFVSDIYRERLNIGGLGVTDGIDEMLTFTDPFEAADAYWAHLATYVIGDDYDVLEVTPMHDPRFDATPKAWRGSIDTLQSLTGKWFTNPNGAANSAARGNRIFKDIPDQSTGGPTVPTTPTATNDLYILVDAGHRETGTGGADANPVERNLTDDMAEAYVTALRADGIKADWYQRDLDLDDLPRDTRGSLDTLSLGINAYLKTRTEKNLVFVSCHYDGAHQDYHVIYPDETGLTTMYKGGAPGYDTAANNPLDIKLAQAISFAFDKIPNMTPLTQASPYVGLMSEGRTGVADSFKARLAVFAATVPVRDVCVRLVIEHGGTDDVAARRPTFTEECADAFVAAIRATYKVVTDQPTDQPPPIPTTPSPTDPKYVTPSLPIWFTTVAKSSFPQNQVFENGVRFIAGKKKLRVKKATVQRATASIKGARSGQDLASGTPVDVLGTFTSGKQKYVLAAGSDDHQIAKGARILLADLDEATTTKKLA